MRLSTRIFLGIGLLPVFVGLTSIALAIIVEMMGCETGLCNKANEAAGVLHWYVLMGMYSIPGALLFAFVFNNIYDKLDTKREDVVDTPTQSIAKKLGRSLIVLLIMGTVAGLLFVVFGVFLDSHTAKSMREFDNIRISCAESLLPKKQQDIELCGRESADASKNCIRVDGRKGEEQVTYVVDRDLYEQCMRESQM